MVKKGLFGVQLGMILFLAVFLTAIGLIYSYKEYCKVVVPGKSEFGKAPVINREQIFPGFMLFTPLNLTNAASQGGSIYLTDLYGRVVYKWETQFRTQYSVLKPNGNLVVSQTNITDKDYPQAARITSIQELDKNSQVVWEYKNSGLHHDFDILPDGNIAVLEWVKIPEEMVSQIRGGRPGTEFHKKDIFTDKILEIDKNKQVVWSWNAAEHLDIQDYEIPLMFPKEQWSHANSIKYIKTDPFFKKEAYLVSMRYFNTVFLISKDSGSIIWQAPKGLLGHQHDATLLENGNVLIFNNAFHTSVSSNYYNYGSEVLEINPLNDRIVWEFSGGDNPLDKARLTEVILSGAQRLKNGNTLITLGTSGRMIEVSPEKKVVWDFINPYFDHTDQPFPSNYIFKSRRYNAEQIPWLKQFGDPMPVLPSYCN